MSHHYSGPDFTCPHDDARLDFCDLFGFQYTGDDFFADKDVCSIVLELPNSELGANEVGLWARTLVPADGGGWVQVDRQAHAQQVTALTPNEGKVEYLAGEPADDAR